MNSIAQHRALCFVLNRESLERRGTTLQDQVIGTADDLIRAFATTAAASPPAAGVPGTLIVREGASPGFAVIGDLDDAAVARVLAFFDHLEEAVGPLHFVSYAQAEQDAAVLAERLAHRFTPTALDEAVFRPIPRGGLIVLGMLAMAMGLRHDQLTPHDGDDDRLTVFIDDCALSGYRIHQTLQATHARRIGLGLLYAPDEVCQNIESAEERVQGCVAARRLRDVGPRLHGRGHEAWVEDWTQRLGDQRYWIGRPESVAFAWKEPDRSFINAATGEREAGWQVVPGELTRPAHGSDGERLTVQVQPVARGPIRPSNDVFFADLDGSVVIAHAGQEAAIELSPVASGFWRCLIQHGSIDAVIDELWAGYDVERAVLEADVTRFVDDLVGRGILEAPTP